jgi:hypothetical protein
MVRRVLHELIELEHAPATLVLLPEMGEYVK